MSSSAQECFVHIVLPGETEFVTAGRFARATGAHGIAVGRFVYGRSYLARDNAVPIDPLELKLERRVYETTLLQGVFGALRDASPDYWGRRIIERHFGSPGPGELDCLLYSPDDRAGALGFGLEPQPPAPRRKFNRTIDLGKLQEFADAIIAGEELPQTPDAQRAQELMLKGTSMGGARPKAVVEDDGALWIAKFNRRDDKWNHARVERTMLMLACECGIDTAESRLTTFGDRDALLVKRFDREHAKTGYRRARMLSALTLLRAGDTHQDREKWCCVTDWTALWRDRRKESILRGPDARGRASGLAFGRDPWSAPCCLGISSSRPYCSALCGAASAGSRAPRTARAPAA